MALKTKNSFASRLLAGGYRVFFPAAGLHAGLMILLWVTWYLGYIEIPTAFPPLAWHQHELLFGFVPAVIAGFLLTAVPNWTGRPRLSGWPLLVLFVVWLTGRLAIAMSDGLGVMLAIIVSLVFIPAFAAYILRELVAARNIRNYKIGALLLTLALVQGLFDWETRHSGYVIVADKLAIGLIILLIGIVGGRIIPTFTANWLRRNSPGRLPPEFGPFDQAAMVLSCLALGAWPMAQHSAIASHIAATLMLAAGIAQLARQARWCPERTLAEPLVTILHIAFFFVPFGFLTMAAALALGDGGLHSAAVHAWTGGAIGTMTLAVMTRATRGHSGQPLHAPISTVIIVYAPVVGATLVRMAAAILPDHMTALLSLAGTAWIVAFFGFVALYGRMFVGKA
jgi:uncharacterized protein involved in response to NO